MMVSVQAMLCLRKKPINEEVQISAIELETWISRFENLYSQSRETADEENNEEVIATSTEDNAEEEIILDEVQATVQKV